MMFCYLKKYKCVITYLFKYMTHKFQYELH